MQSVSKELRVPTTNGNTCQGLEILQPPFDCSWEQTENSEETKKKNGEGGGYGGSFISALHQIIF